MIKAEELRVNNKLKKDGVIVTIDARSIFDIWDDSKVYEPIPITEDLLVREGFVKTKVGYYIHKEDLGNTFAHLRIANINGIWNASIGDDECGIVLGRYDYFHQIQNLYYAISLQEIEK